MSLIFIAEAARNVSYGPFHLGNAGQDEFDLNGDAILTSADTQFRSNGDALYVDVVDGARSLVLMVDGMTMVLWGTDHLN
jgi:hypothetical protein